MGGADEKLAAVQQAFDKSSLPERPDRDKVDAILVEIRERFWAAG